MFRAVRWFLMVLLILALAATIALHVRSYNHYDHLMGALQGHYIRIDSQHGQLTVTDFPNYARQVPFRFMTTDVSLHPLSQTITITLPVGSLPIGIAAGSGSLAQPTTSPTTAPTASIKLDSFAFRVTPGTGTPTLFPSNLTLTPVASPPPPHASLASILAAGGSLLGNPTTAPAGSPAVTSTSPSTLSTTSTTRPLVFSGIARYASAPPQILGSTPSTLTGSITVVGNGANITTNGTLTIGASPSFTNHIHTFSHTWLHIAVVALLLLVNSLALRRIFIRHARRRRGQCANCGYDLRGNPTAPCPECGTSARPLEMVEPQMNADECR